MTLYYSRTTGKQIFPEAYPDDYDPADIIALVDDVPAGEVVIEEAAETPEAPELVTGEPAKTPAAKKKK